MTEQTGTTNTAALQSVIVERDALRNAIRSIIDFVRFARDKSCDPHAILRDIEAIAIASGGPPC